MTFEPVLRWAQAPPICIAENLPAFNSRADLHKFLDRYAPRATVKRIWQCSSCHLIHASTGTERHQL